MDDIIKDWAIKMGLPVRTKPQTVDFQEAKLMHDLILEEVRELDFALAEQGLAEQVDALGDILWLAIRGLQQLGADPERVINTIAESNNSKFIYDSQNAKVEEAILKDGWKVEHKGGIWRIIDNQGKVRKPLTFVEPDWTWLNE